MYRIIDSRGSGKTSRLMLLAKENNGILVCSNPYAMQDKAYNYGITGIDFISYADFQALEYDTSRPIFIDEAESLLKTFTPHLSGYTISMED